MLDCQRIAGIWWLGSTGKKGLRMEALFRGFLSRSLRTAKRPLCVRLTQKRGRFFIYSGMPCCIISLGGMRLRSSKREACSLRWRSRSVAFSSRNIPFSFKSFRFSSASSSRWASTFSSLASNFAQYSCNVSDVCCVDTVGCSFGIFFTTEGVSPKISQETSILSRLHIFSIISRSGMRFSFSYRYRVCG